MNIDFYKLLNLRCYSCIYRIQSFNQFTFLFRKRPWKLLLTLYRKCMALDTPMGQQPSLSVSTALLNIYLEISRYPELTIIFLSFASSVQSLTLGFLQLARFSSFAILTLQALTVTKMNSLFILSILVQAFK